VELVIPNPGLYYLALSVPLIIELLGEVIDFALLGIKPMRSHDYRPELVRLNDFDSQNQSLTDLCFDSYLAGELQSPAK
jgi:hypothetical protein